MHGKADQKAAGERERDNLDVRRAIRSDQGIGHGASFNASRPHQNAVRQF